MDLPWTRPKARKRYQCDLCGTGIDIGEVYLCQPTVQDNTITNWRECADCDKDEIRSLVCGWASNPDGIDSDIAQEWADEAVVYGALNVQRAANRYIERVISAMVISLP